MGTKIRLVDIKYDSIRLLYCIIMLETSNYNTLYIVLKFRNKNSM